MREAAASGECSTTHCNTGDNYSDMMTKVLYGKKKRDNVARILYDIWDQEDGDPCHIWPGNSDIDFIIEEPTQELDGLHPIGVDMPQVTVHLGPGDVK